MDSQEYFVHWNISIRKGEWWGTFALRSTGSLRRIVSVDLPMRQTRQEAEADLKNWLAKRARKNRN